MTGRIPPPDWAMRRAVAGDREAAEKARRLGVLRTNWGLDAAPFAEHALDRPPLAWTKQHRWKAPWWAFLDRGGAFLHMILASDERFDLALQSSGAELYVPRDLVTLTDDDLRDLDALYEETEDRGALGRRPNRWGELVAELRHLRRAVEAGVTLEVEGRRLGSWGAFYAWAHGRYAALEDGYDEWIGDDG